MLPSIARVGGSAPEVKPKAMMRSPLAYRPRTSLTQTDLELLAQNEQNNHVAHKQWLAAKADGLKAKQDQAGREAGALKRFEREDQLFKRTEQQLVKQWHTKKVLEHRNSAFHSQEADAQWRMQMHNRGQQDEQELQRKREQGFTVCTQEGKDSRKSSIFLPPLLKHGRYP